MAKELTKKAGISAAETVLRSFMPELFKKLEQIEKRFDTIERRFDEMSRLIEGLRIEFKEDLYDKTEQTRDVINEVAQRIAKLEGRIQGYFETARNQNNKIDGWIERIVKVEMMQESRRRKAS